ncbi:MAG: hypothetical protein AAC990_00260 [Dehalococcoides mccartyi]|uniref:hypothetical protein n=1 Tax=Dehalococcoides mccartyi TaxID=61435 RepID=UPI002FCBDED6
MPGEFYIEGKQQKVDLTEIKNVISEVQTSITQLQNSVTTLLTKSEGLVPVTGSVTADWQTAESNVVTIGAGGARCKVHSLLLSIRNLAGTSITVRIYMRINGIERKVYEQSFNAATDPPGLWVINGTLGIHEALRVTLQSNDAADNGKSVDYDFMLEAMS